jgi:hypothetical protein
LAPAGDNECHRSGKSSKKKKKKVAHHRFDFEEQSIPEQSIPPRYEVSESPAQPSEDVLSKTAYWMLVLASTPSGSGWVKEMKDALDPMRKWLEQSEALASDSLLHLALRCKRAAAVEGGMRFVTMMYELLFTAKLNRYVLF